MGPDFTGVPTNMLTVNGTLRLSVYNPATFFGIRVSSTPVNLIYSDVVAATGQLKKYFQSRKSHRTVLVNVEGLRVPLYGAGSAINETKTGYQVPPELKFDL
ncbi:hypothetical protein DCAR_0311401 [Daucus carota subsp. sativus]|uniref:Uncharacterized protein n=1 Tax=Daucus carota subsp. sativus TaxID=79200 RepID=A0A166AJC6_DAUCS|nr:hypothetical protein DCAR_0311401 [Daucus carota subsp. sativus]